MRTKRHHWAPIGAEQISPVSMMAVQSAMPTATATDPARLDRREAQRREPAASFHDERNQVSLDRLSTKQAAHYLGLSARSLERWRGIGEGPPFLKLGDRVRSAVRYLKSDLDAWLVGQRFNSTAEYRR